MTKYARKNGLHWIDVYDVPGDFPDIEALNRSLPGGGFVVVDSGLQPGALHNDGDGSSETYVNPTVVETPSPRPPSISGVRFEAVFAKACGKAYFENALRALETIGATDPATNDTADIARALRAFRKPPEGGIDFPFENWKSAPNDKDLTGELLRGIIAALSGVDGFSDIETKIDAALEDWSALQG